MTKVIVLGEPDWKPTGRMPITFHDVLMHGGNLKKTNQKPKSCNYIELVCKNYGELGEDLMFAYHKDRHGEDKAMFLGYFNDGVVE